VCGWLCPFGLVQDLVHRIPFVKKWKKLPGERFLRYLKYLVLAGLVITLPMVVSDALGYGVPWFCKYLCPSGTLFGSVPLLTVNPVLRQAAGGLFWWKLGLLIFFLVLALLIWRPFCRYLCPLGAIYGLFNPIAACRFRIDEDACTHCGACQRVCKLDIPVHKQPNHRDCMRCGDCKRACPHGAIHSTWERKPKEVPEKA